MEHVYITQNNCVYGAVILKTAEQMLMTSLSTTVDTVCHAYGLLREDRCIRLTDITASC